MKATWMKPRMQKELKQLLTDPPPGVSFPFLSPNSDLSDSHSIIDAEIKGPEGTVYAGGIFKLKIQIPERYPFQPPVVTFATQIYHPKIDNEGQVHLDVLTQGGWTPCFVIATALTRIVLLLSEPNLGDAYMCEASKEYKDSRHEFEQRARSMTEKFANQTQSSISTVKSEGPEFDEFLLWTKRKLELFSLCQKADDEKDIVLKKRNISSLNLFRIGEESLGGSPGGNNEKQQQMVNSVLDFDSEASTEEEEDEEIQV